jgi:hypothetical protein
MTLAAAYGLMAANLGAYNALEADYVRSLSEAATYRQLFLIALEDLAAERQRAERLNERLQQIAGSRPWHETPVE